MFDRRQSARTYLERTRASEVMIIPDNRQDIVAGVFSKKEKEKKKPD